MGTTVTGAAFQSGTYLPTVSNQVNTVGVPIVNGNAKYVRIGNIVTVYGEISVDPVAITPTATTWELSLPIASSLAFTYNLSGHITGGDFIEGGGIRAQVANNRAYCFYSASTSAADVIFFSFMYEIL